MLSLSSKYAISALIVLSGIDADKYVSVKAIAEKTDIPPAFLSKLMKTLAQNKIVVSKKGALGGVKIQRKKVSFYEVCKIFEDPILKEQCVLSSNNCQADNHCAFHSSWKKERSRVHSFLRNAKICSES